MGEAAKVDFSNVVLFAHGMKGRKKWTRVDKRREAQGIHQRMKEHGAAAGPVELRPRIMSVE